MQFVSSKCASSGFFLHNQTPILRGNYKIPTKYHFATIESSKSPQTQTIPDGVQIQDSKPKKQPQPKKESTRLWNKDTLPKNLHILRIPRRPENVQLFPDYVFRVIRNGIRRKKGTPFKEVLFKVDYKLGKKDIEAFLTQVYNIKVMKVNTANYDKKFGREKPSGRVIVQKSGYKKAYVTVDDRSNPIDFETLNKPFTLEQKPEFKDPEQEIQQKRAERAATNQQEEKKEKKKEEKKEKKEEKKKEEKNSGWRSWFKRT